MTIEQFARLIQVAKTKTEYDAACARFRHEHGAKALEAALDTIDEIMNGDIAERNARIAGGPPYDVKDFWAQKTTKERYRRD